MQNRAFLPFVLFGMLLTGCSVFLPDSAIITSRISNRGNYEGTNIGLVFRNPWMPRKVVQENLITTDGGIAPSDLP